MQDRTATIRAAGYAVFLTAVWIVAAWLRPGTTYHLAPILVAAAPPVILRLSSDQADRPTVVGLAAGGTVVALGASLLLSAVGKLEGPSLLPSGGALAESLIFAFLGGAVGLVAALAMKSSRLTRAQ